MIQQILYTACVTPFLQGGSKIDYASLRRIIQNQVNAGNGLVILGSTGEGLSISAQERQELMKFVCEIKPDVPLIVGVPSHNFEAALEWIDFCNNFPIDGYLMTTPIYTKPGILGQTKWFEALLEKSLFPSMLYNIPGRSAIKLHSETVKNLAQHPRFFAIKDSGGSLESMIDYQSVAPHVLLYCGDDHLMPAMAVEGAVGLVSVASNAWPKAMRKYVMRALKGEITNGAHSIWWKACQSLFKASNPIPIKALLKEIGLITSDSVRLPLSRDDLDSVDELVFYHEKISELSSADGEI